MHSLLVHGLHCPRHHTMMMYRSSYLAHTTSPELVILRIQQATSPECILACLLLASKLCASALEFR